ncbi:WD repeat-containing protein [Reticulomyxa filosa]|uniref:WD repeat-containing protein n=1 Tax=Reticulomyxa filosa TaxID=46433 RepID=X6P7M3_RETFI|nr:WD repeat-containing protein [Reticulomyxa filosa]|eukprot:ETO33637.1 WD repeat-containing protein [Reticulomyxa filosa]
MFNFLKKTRNWKNWYSWKRKSNFSTTTSEEEEIQKIVQHWIRVFSIKLGWIKDFDKLVIKYATTIFMFDTFRLSSKLLKSLYGHHFCVNSIDYSTYDGYQFICSGSIDNTVCVWDIDNSKQIRSFNEHSSSVSCVKFSSYHYHSHRQNVICSSSGDKTIRFWDFKRNKQLQIFNGHTYAVCDIVFSQFNCGQYLCSVSWDKTIRLWDIETSKQLHIFNGHTSGVWSVDISPLQGNNNKKNDNINKSNSIGVIGGNGYTICSGSDDKTIRIWDIKTTQQLIVFKGHNNLVKSVKYCSNESGNIGGANTILSGSIDKSVRLWDIRSGQQIQVFNGHTCYVNAVEYSPFVVNNNEVVGDISNVICSASADNTIRFWDIRSNKNELYVERSDKEDCGINCFTFFKVKKKENKIERKYNRGYDINMCYGSYTGIIRFWE